MQQRLATSLLALILSGARPYEAPAKIVVQSSSACPSASQVGEVLGPLLPDTVVDTAGAGNDGSTRVEIRDRGDDFSVRVAGQERVFDDAERSCAQRARLAAVFVGLVLAPPLEPERLPEKREPAAKPAAVPIPVPASAAEPSVNALELALMLQAAPGAETSEPPLAGGLGARFVHGKTLGLSLGAAAFLPTTLHFELADARIVRAPFDVSLRLRSAPSSFETSGEIGVFVGLLLASGERVRNEQSELRPEFGARAALSASLELDQSVASFLSVHGSFVPKPHEFELRPSARAGAMPAWWVGGALGVSLRL